MPLAIFDLDNTLLAGDSDYLWGQYLGEIGVVDRHSYERENDRFYREYREGRLDIMAFLAFSLKPLSDHPRSELDRWHARFMAEKIEPLITRPAEDLVARHRTAGDTLMVITATNVRTGRPKIFRQPEISVDALMASACLPTLFRAVEIDGEAYWDGGFMGNPALFPLVDECDARDTIIVQINPIERDELPTTAADIANRVNEITFNASLIKELRSLGFLWEVIHHENLKRDEYRDARIHRIHGGDTMLNLSVSSKFNAEWEFLVYLRDAGREAAGQWLEDHYDDIGRVGTFDISGLFEESLKPAHLAEGTQRVKKSEVDS